MPWRGTAARPGVEPPDADPLDLGWTDHDWPEPEWPDPSWPGFVAGKRRPMHLSHLAVSDWHKERQQRQPADQAAKQQVEHPHRHKPGMLPAATPTLRANTQANRLCAVLEPRTPAAHRRTASKAQR